MAVSQDFIQCFYCHHFFSRFLNGFWRNSLVVPLSGLTLRARILAPSRMESLVRVLPKWRPWWIKMRWWNCSYGIEVWSGRLHCTRFVPGLIWQKRNLSLIKLLQLKNSGAILTQSSTCSLVIPILLLACFPLSSHFEYFRITHNQLLQYLSLLISLLLNLLNSIIRCTRRVKHSLGHMSTP